MSVLAVVQEISQVSSIGVGEGRRGQLCVVELALDVGPKIVEKIALGRDVKVSGEVVAIISYNF